ncbi:MAG: radical SAM protein [Spirochaetota bacterium]
MEENSLIELYENCTLCPRNCGINRRQGKRGYCGEIDIVKLSSATVHMGEEPPVSGEKGSGTVFFAGCSLQCPFCQNYQISRDGLGRGITIEELSAIFIALKKRGAENINLVTGTHFLPSIVAALHGAREKGLTLPVVWNSSGYESVKTIDCLDPWVDIYLPDLKTLDCEMAQKLFKASDYPEKASQAVLEMASRKKPVYSGAKLISGVILRHLVLPGMLTSTREVLQWFSENLYGKAVLSLMVQYIPRARGPGNEAIPGRTVDERECDTLLEWLNEYGIDEGFIQEAETGTEWVPDFNNANPFPSDLSQVVWHWKMSE